MSETGNAVKYNPKGSAVLRTKNNKGHGAVMSKKATAKKGKKAKR
tara:strand:- start:16403 stop:16537 length:135 start_codon:yes stop_codon:yes gene_type:complete